MRKSQTIDRNRRHRAQAGKLLWPTAVVAFLFTVSYPVNDFAPPPSPPDIGLDMLLVYAAIAAVTVGVVFGLGWALTGACPGPLFALLAAWGVQAAGNWLPRYTSPPVSDALPLLCS